ncbi:MAG: PaaI family thioesterase [Acidimicrobiia bacterium]
MSTTDNERPLAAIPIPLHDLLGLEFTSPEPGATTAEVRMPVRREACGPTGSLHGGAIATMVDFACALAAVRASNFDATSESLITADMHLRYLGRPRTTTVVATAEVVKVGATLIVVECRVTDGADHLVAVGDFSMMKVSRRHPLLPGTEPAAGAPEL